MSDDEKKRDDPYALKDIFTEIEMELVQSLQRNLAKHKLDEINAGFSWEMWQKAMLRNIQRYRNEIKHIIDGYRPAVQDAISEVLQGTYDKVAEEALKTMEQAQIKLDAGSFSFPENGKNTGRVGETPPNETQFFDINRKKMDALIKSTTDDFEDASNAIYRKMDDVYRQTIFKTEFQLSSGSLSLDTAIDKATESFLSKGIDCIIYKNGNHVNIATYAEMALRTASQRAKFLADGSKRDEFGRHLVFVSAHFNSCRLCLPWQGKVLIDDVFSHPSDEYKAKYKGQYKLLSQAIKTGLMHPNCRHTIANYYEGITRLPEVPDDDTALLNYEAEQKQRKLENAIRKAKRKAAGVVDDKNKEVATKEVRQLQKELRDHLKDNPKLKRHPHREKVRENVKGQIKPPYSDGLDIPFQQKQSSVNVKLKGTKDHVFSDGTYEGFESIIRKANIYELDNGSQIITPLDVNKEIQPIRINDVAEVISKMPRSISKFIKEIEIVDYKNPQDARIAEAFGKENFTSAAIGGNKKITFFPSKNNRSIEQIKNIVYHESGHIIEDEFYKETNVKISDSDLYAECMQKDKLHSGKEFVSHYSLSTQNYKEDLAESFKQFIMDEESFKTQFPNRFELIEELIKWSKKK